ncbi:MAG: RNA polymerase sigma factor [Prevotella sp.]
MKNISFRNDILPLKDVLYRLALRITLKREEAEDIVQDTLIKVWNRRDNWNEIDSIEAYCLTICRNLALDRIKKRENLNESLEDNGNDSPDKSFNPFEDTLQQDRIDLVRNLVNALPEKQRSCMQLRDFEGKSYKDIAEILEISEDQVKINIFRARQTVKERFKNYDNYGL